MQVNRPILVVDDDLDIREFIAAALIMEGHHVLMAENGQVALDLLLTLDSNSLPRCIMLDIMMPVMTGEEFLKAIKKSHEELRRIPVVVASTNGVVYRDLLVKDFFKKPIDISELYRIAEQYS